MGEAVFIGFGEAGFAFASERSLDAPGVRAIDIKNDDPTQREELHRRYARANVSGYDTAARLVQAF